MMTQQIARETVKLESIGPVDVSEIFIPVDSFGASATGRPSPGYYEVAVLWGQDDDYGLSHCSIVDSNFRERGPADQLYETLTDATQLARYMHHVLAHPNEWDA